MENNSRADGALITIQEKNGELYADSRDIAAALDIEHAALIATIDKHKHFIESEFETRVLFQKGPFRTPGGIQQIRYALLTEGQSLYVGTLSRNTPTVMRFKAVLVKAFLAARALEQQAVPAPVPKFEIPATYAGALRLAANLSDEKEQALAELRDAAAMLEEAQPMVAAYEDFLVKDKQSYSWNEAAKMFDKPGRRMGQNRLIALLREEGILMTGNRKSHNVPMQKYIELDYFRVYPNEEYGTVTTLVTPKGMGFLSRTLAEIEERKQAVVRQIASTAGAAAVVAARRPHRTTYYGQPPLNPAIS